jgi:histidine triad (HIT) family protein
VGECLFCRIIDGRVPAEKVYQSEGAVAFLDIMAAARGHTLVIPRVHAATLAEVPDDAVGDLFKAVKVVMGQLDRALHPPAYHVGWNHGTGAGQHVFHLHVHVLPRFEPGGAGVQLLGEGGDRGELAALGAAIRAAAPAPPR